MSHYTLSLESPSAPLQFGNEYQLANLTAGKGDSSTRVLSTDEPLQPSQSRFRNSVNKWWLWESISWLVALAALMAILITLRMHKGRPLPNWPYSITVNSLISLLATILKTAMMIPIAEGRALCHQYYVQGLTDRIRD